MVNKVILVGRITSKPIITTASTGTQFTRFTLAANKPVAGGEADFIPCVAFNRTAELAAQYLDKGSMIAIEGRINSSNFTNKEGQNVTRIEVNVERLTFLESRNTAQNRNNDTNSTVQQTQNVDVKPAVETQNEQNNNQDNQIDDLDFVF